MAPRERKTKGWSVEEKVRILSETKDLTGRELAAYLERERVLLARLEQWRLALEEEGVATPDVRGRRRRRRAVVMPRRLSTFAMTLGLGMR